MRALIALFLLLPAAAQATSFDIDPAHSGVSFKIRHMFTQVPGSFKKYSGTFDFDPKNPKSWKTSVTIDSASIFTDNEKRDAHLKSADFFDVQKFPTITFTSKSVKSTGKEKAELSGDLTMHGVTKTVNLIVDVGGMGKDPMGTTRAGFNATTKVKRSDFGITWNKTLDSGNLLLGDDVEISISVEGTESKPAAASTSAAN
jgi:polyisoprenoid-binding protein YceI